MAVGGIASTWTVLSTTWDEPVHLATGMEWLDKGKYTSYSWQFAHPPLANVELALLPYVEGMRSHSLQGPIQEGNAILSSSGSYRTNLIYLRAGNLLFLAVSCVAVFLWARRWFGRATAFFAVLLFVSLPPILGHAGLATLDVAAAATMMLVLYALLRCLEDPTWQKLLFLGASLALAVLCKYSVIPFFAACVFCALVYARVRWWSVPVTALPWRRLFRRALIVTGIVIVLLWAGFRFHCQPLSTHSGAHAAIDHMLANHPALRSAASKAADVPFPLSELVTGMWCMAHLSAIGDGSYLLGEYRETGWWYFFPIAVGVKTPIGFLILAGCGIFAILRRLRSGPWQRHLTVIFSLAIMLVCISSRLDLGVRHILAIYLLLAVIAGYAVSEFVDLARRRSRAILTLPAILVAWVVADCWMARPDYFPYFNQFAGAHPERILAESDLDLGQDLFRLGQRLRELHVDHVAIRYSGVTPFAMAGLPPSSVFSPFVPTTHGYVAVSVRCLTLDYARDGSYKWLRGRTPTEKIGTSMFLYDFGP
jgi:4-amino-4-deoxy-L-arabinose transferase-like glycosyltransferase